MSEDVGMRRGQQNARGLGCIKLTKQAKVVSRWCMPGDIILIEEPRSNPPKLMPQEDGLNERLAQTLVDAGKAVLYQLRPGERGISVAPVPPKRLPSGNELDQMEIETATDKRPAAAERAVAPRGKAAV